MNIDLIHLSRPCSMIFPSPILSSIGFTVSFSVWDHIYFPAKGYLQIIADSAQTEYCSNFHFPYVRPHDISHFSNIYIGINAIRYIRKSIKPYIYTETNSSWLCIPDQGTPHNTTLPRDQFLIQTFAQLTSMITLANLTTLNISTNRIKIQNPHCLLCLIFFILFFSKYFHTLPFFTNQVFPLPNISLVFLLLQIFSHFSTQSSSVSQTK